MEVETQKKNNCLNTWVDGDTTGDADAKQSSQKYGNRC